jgi:hypothetical protein
MSKSLIKMYQLEISRLVYLQNKFNLDYKEHIENLRAKRDLLIFELQTS